MFARTYFRDHVRLDGGLLARITHGLAPGPVLVAGRIVEVVGDADLWGRDLVVLAERLVDSGGALLVRGQESSPSLTVVAREIDGLRATAVGAPGPSGEPGRAGRAGRPGKNASLPFKPGGNGGPGGAGGVGRPGGVGGVGGTIAIRYVTGDPATWQLGVPGGPGGVGGAGGAGGPGGEGGAGDPDGEPGPDGPDGPDGPAGPIGPDGVQDVLLVDDAAWEAALVPLADAWSDYRARVGEYFFRAANPADPVRSTYLGIAAAELSEAVRLDAGNTRAAQLHDRIRAGQNVFGLARDADILPDFERYEQVLVDYGPLVLSVFDGAKDLLAGNLTLDQLKATVAREIAHLVMLEQVLKVEQAAAQRGVSAAQADRQFAVDQFNANQGRITARQTELEDQRFGWFDFIGVAAFTGLAAVITLATGGGAAAVAAAYAPQVLVRLAGDDTGAFSHEGVDALLDAALGLKDFTKDNLDPGKKLLLSYGKLLSDVESSTSDDELKALMRETIELTHAKLVGQLRVEQATLTLAAAGLRIQQAAADRALAEAHLASMTADTAFLEKVAQGLLASARGYMDVLMRYAFLAARSVEIYTGQDMSGGVFYDYGFLHPDVEEDYLDGTLPLAQLIGANLTSWNRFVGILGYRTAYDDYLAGGDRVMDKVFLTVDDTASIAQFKQAQLLEVVVDLDDLPATRFNATAAYVLVSLAGAQASVPAISTIVEHGGVSMTRSRQGTDTVQVLQPHATVVQTARTPLGYSGAGIGQDPSELSFWGRGVASRWRLRIEPDEMTRRGVDLSGLSQIQLEIGYQAFL